MSAPFLIVAAIACQCSACFQGTELSPLRSEPAYANPILIRRAPDGFPLPGVTGAQVYGQDRPAVRVEGGGRQPLPPIPSPTPQRSKPAGTSPSPSPSETAKKALGGPSLDWSITENKMLTVSAGPAGMLYWEDQPGMERAAADLDWIYWVNTKGRPFMLLKQPGGRYLWTAYDWMDEAQRRGGFKSLPEFEEYLRNQTGPIKYMTQPFAINQKFLEDVGARPNGISVTQLQLDRARWEDDVASFPPIKYGVIAGPQVKQALESIRIGPGEAVLALVLIVLTVLTAYLLYIRPRMSKKMRLI